MVQDNIQLFLSKNNIKLFNKCTLEGELSFLDKINGNIIKHHFEGIHI